RATGLSRGAVARFTGHGRLGDIVGSGEPDPDPCLLDFREWRLCGSRAGAGTLHDHRRSGIKSAGKLQAQGKTRHGPRRIAQGFAAPNGWCDRGVAQGVWRAAHRPRLVLAAGAGHGSCLWQHRAIDPGGQRQRSRAAHDHRPGLGPQRGQGGRQGDPRVGAWSQPPDRRAGNPGADPRAQRGEAARTDPGRREICRGRAGCGTQGAATRDGGSAPPRKGQRDLAGRAPKVGTRHPAPDRRSHQARRRDPGAERQGNPSGMMSVAEVLPGSLPRHIAIIMDGNGRWARGRGLPRIAGHRRGADAVRRTVAAAGEIGIPYLTLFGFSSENWKRPLNEVDDLMGLLRHYLRGEIAELHGNGVRLPVIREKGPLPSDIVAMIDNAEKLTRDNGGINLTVALSYGGRAEIAAAARAIAAGVSSGDLPLDAVDEELIARHLFTADLPDPDLLIRTSGEQRVSNFLLWQCAYAELVFTKTLWPDFGRGDLEQAISDYSCRERRYGTSVGSG